MSEIINKYIIESNEILNQDKDLQKYEEELRNKKNLLEVVTLNAHGIRALLHPFRLIRTYKELNRIDDIRDRYYELKRSNLLEHFDEETGDLEDDLKAASRHFKPERMKWFIKNNPVRDEEIDKKLIKIRK